MSEIVLHDFDFEVRHLLDALEDFEPSAAALALQAVRGIGYELQFVQHELRQEQHTLEEVHLADVGDSPVDDDAGIEDLGLAAAAMLAAKQAAERLKIQHIALVRADNQTDIGHNQKKRDVQKGARAFRDGGALQYQAHQVCADDAKNRTDRRADQAPQARSLEPNLKQENG